MDAIRTSDGAKVALKRVEMASLEADNTVWLAEQSAESGQCHTVPILDVVNLPTSEKVKEPVYCLLVMPFLRSFNDPPFHCRSEFIEAILQLLRVSCSLTDEYLMTH